MNKSFKISLWALGVLILLSLVAMLGVNWLVDPNRFKPQIVAMVKQRTGRDLSVPGDLRITLLPRPGIKIGRLSLSNAAGFTDKAFAEVNDAELAIKWLPLLNNQMALSRIVLRGLTLKLSKNKQGESNWKDLNAAASASGTASPSAPLAADQSPIANAFSVDVLRLEQAQIGWEDQQAGRAVSINDIQLHAEQVALAQPITIALSFKADAGLPQQVHLTTRLWVGQQLNAFKMNALKLNSTLAGASVPGGNLAITGLMDTLEYDQAQKTVKLEGMQLSSQNLNIKASASGRNVGDNIDLQGSVQIVPFNPKQFMQQQKITLPALQDPSALTSFAADLAWHGHGDSVRLDKVDIKLDQSRLTGKAEWVNFQQPLMTLSAELDSLDADRYFPPQAHIPTPMLSSALVIAAADQLLQPLERLKKVALNGKVLVRQLKMNHLEMQDVNLDLQSKPGELRTQQSVGQLYQGSYQGNASLTLLDNLPHLRVDETFRHIDLASFFTALNMNPYLTGIMDATAKMQGQGMSQKALAASLAGDLQFQIIKGAFRHFDLQKLLQNVKSLVNGQALDMQSTTEQTLFSDLKGTGTVKQGVIENHDLMVNAAPVAITGEGSIDLNTAQIAYQLKAALVDGTTPIQEINHLPLLLVVEGALANPAVHVAGVGAFLEKHLPKIEQKKDQLLEKLDSTLKKKLGVGAADLLKKLF